MRFSDEAKAHLHRFLVRCDHDTGVSVNQFREYFENFFIRLRNTAGSEDASEWFDQAESLWSGVQVHRTYYLHANLSAQTQLECASLRAVRYCDSGPGMTLAQAIQKDGNTHSYKKLPDEQEIVNAAAFRHEGQTLTQSNPFTNQVTSTIFSATLHDDTSQGFPTVTAVETFIQAICSYNSPT